VQQINYLDGQARLRLAFVENLCRFLAKRGTPLERIPIVEYRVLDLCRLYKEVATIRGGMNAVSENKQWSEVARVLGMAPTAGGSLRQHYARLLLPYEMYRTEAAAREKQQLSEKKKRAPQQPQEEEPPTTTTSTSNGGDEASGSSTESADAKEQTSAGKNKGGANAPKASAALAAFAEGLPLTRAAASEAAAAMSEPAHGNGAAPEAAAAAAQSRPDADEEGSDDEYVGFGYHDGKKYTLATYKDMADGFKRDYFGKDIPEVTEEQIESEYWRIVTTADHDMRIEYGSELHSTTHGSGFPTSGNALNPLDSATGSVYTRSPWNLNNLNACSLLRYVKEDIPGVISPWVYVGMCFSTFCWHCEDHFLYSINYLWEGEPKMWYGVSGDEAEKFEEAMRDYAPELFKQQPDLLFHLVTMISPSLLRAKGLNVCKAVQRAGEFMLTFPRAYHGGFNTGYNVAESCNFAITNWLPWGWLGDQEYRKYGRPQVTAL
jgi:hypothetical protein